MMTDEPGVILTEKAIQERLQQRKETNCQRQARWQRLSINGAIRIQAIVGALTTASQLQDQHTYSRSLNHPLREGFLLGLLVQLGAAVAVLGGISTVLASYLAKVRGLGEPKPLLIRTRELNSFPREIPTFIVDDGDKFGKEYDGKITTYRERFEDIIKTEGEDAGPPGSGGHWRPPSTFCPPLRVPLPAHVLAGYHGVSPVQVRLGAHVVGEKRQMWKYEKVIGGV